MPKFDIIVMLYFVQFNYSFADNQQNMNELKKLVYK